MPIGTDLNGYAEKVHRALLEAGFRSEIDLRNEKIGYKIRGAEVQKIPFMLVLGRKEEEEGTVAVRQHRVGAQEVLPLEGFVERLRQEVAASFRRVEA